MFGDPVVLHRNPLTVDGVDCGLLEYGRGPDSMARFSVELDADQVQKLLI